METKTQAPGSRFEFVAVASARARQLLQGCTPRVEVSAKPARTARREVEAGTVVKESGAGLEPKKKPAAE
jgi:DNA-directed RNA polymerase subunit K/omega